MLEAVGDQPAGDSVAAPVDNLHVRPGDAPVVTVNATRVSGAGLLVVDLQVEDPPPGLEVVTLDGDELAFEIRVPFDVQGRWVGVVTARDGMSPPPRASTAT